MYSDIEMTIKYEYKKKLFTGCLQDEYRCENKCIELVKRCDKVADCDREEDETDCSESANNCNYKVLD